MLALVLVLTACGAGRSAFVTPTSSDRYFVAGYHPYWAGDAWTTYPDGVLDELIFFEIEAAGDGTLLDRHGWPERWRSLVEDARQGGAQVTPTISMHDPAAFRALFADPAATDRLTAGLLDLFVTTPGLAGLHLDFEVFEPVDLDVRDGYTAFVAALAARLRDIDPALSLSVFTLAFDDADVYNERALAEVADFLIVQGYDYHSAASDSAGPPAAVRGWGRLSWTAVVDRFQAMGIPPRKMVMSVPLFGYEWPVVGGEPGARTRGHAVAIPLAPPAAVLPELPRAPAQAMRHGLRRDADSGSAWYAFRDESGWRQGWFDDATSLRAKYEFVRQRGLGGVALFPVAYADTEIWRDLERAFAAPRR